MEKHEENEFDIEIIIEDGEIIGSNISIANEKEY